jgi:ferric-dicitrate binding protein FerR (iron transport regulator)
MVSSNSDNDFIWTLLGKHFTKNIAEDEEKLVQQWKNKSPENLKMYDECKSIWDQAYLYSSLDVNPEKAWDTIASKIAKPVVTKYRKIWIISSVAAALLITIVLSVHIFNASVVVKAQNDVRQIVLMDGSVVDINRNSVFQYPKHFGKKFRRVKILKGEVFFSIHKDSLHPFIVNTPKADIKVVGTSFNVNVHENNDFEVAVQSGKVFIEVPDVHKGLLLKPTQQVYYSVLNKKITTANVNDWNFLGWKTHEFRFKETNLSYVFSTLEKAYGISIKADSSILNLKITATFINLPLNEILTIIDKTFSLQTKRKNGCYLVEYPDNIAR